MPGEDKMKVYYSSENKRIRREFHQFICDSLMNVGVRVRIKPFPPCVQGNGFLIDTVKDQVKVKRLNGDVSFILQSELDDMTSSQVGEKLLSMFPFMAD